MASQFLTLISTTEVHAWILLLEFCLHFQLLEASRALFIDNAQHSASSTTSSELHQLLVILSDGRGVFAEGTLVS